MNLENAKSSPPPIPESAKRKGPPPIPEAAKRKAGPPPVPEAVRQKSLEAAKRRLMEQGELQEADVVEAFEMQGFDGLEVTATLEKKNVRKEDADAEARKKEGISNQDNLLLDPETGLMGVLDGLGGEGQGDLASKAAERAIIEGYRQASQEIGKLGGAEVQQKLVEQQLTKMGNPAARKQVTEMVEGILGLDPKLGKKALSLLEGVRRANAAVKETKGKTTACVGFVHESPDGKHYAVVANVGDSIAFKRRKNGEMVPITEEDSLLNALQRSGSLSADQLAKMKNAPDQKQPIPLTLDLVRAAGGGEKEFKQLQASGVKEMPMSYNKLKRSMVASLGSEVFEPSLTVRELKPGEELILMTDIADNFENAQTNEMDGAKLSEAYQGKTQTERLDKLRQAAKAGPKDDDAAMVSAKVKE